MTPTPVVLPAAFADLAPFAAWALPTETARNRRRLASDMGEIRAFAEAMLPRLDAIAAHLDGFALDALPQPEAALFAMMLSVAEIAPAIECYDQPAVQDGYDSARFPAVETHRLRPAF